MERYKLLVYAFVLGTAFSLTGTFLKVLHWPFGSLILGIGLCFCLVYTVISLIEIFQSTRIETNEKIMWGVGFFFFSMVAFLAYIIWGRQRIVYER